MTPADGTSVGRARLHLFAVSWAFAAAFEQFYSGQWLATPGDAILTAAALLCLFARHRLPLFAAFAAIQAAVWIGRMPAVFNHVIFGVALDVSFLLAVATAWVRRRGAGTVEDIVASDFVPVARWALVLVYGFAVLHKLNADFLLDLDRSCAVSLYANLARELHVLPPLAYNWMRAGAVALAIASEAAIPILLMVKRWRPIGLAWGTAFHVPLLMLNPDFTIIIFAVYMLFLPAATCLHESSRLSRLAARPAAAVLIAGAVLLALNLVSPAYTKAAATLLALLFIAPFCVVVFDSVRDRPNAAPAEPEADVPPAAARLSMLPLAVVVCFGCSPYLGFRTEGAFSMFSNLRTEGSVTNHLFLPRWHRLRYQDDLVEVTRTTSPELAAQASGRLLVYHAFKQHVHDALARDGDFEVDFRRNGGDVTVAASARELASRFEPASYLEEKLLDFRPVWLDRRCVH